MHKIEDDNHLLLVNLKNWMYSMKKCLLYHLRLRVLWTLGPPATGGPVGLLSRLVAFPPAKVIDIVLWATFGVGEPSLKFLLSAATGGSGKNMMVIVFLFFSLVGWLVG